MSAHEFSISVTDLDAAGRDYRFVVRPGWVRGALEGHEAKASDKDGVLAVRASKSAGDVVVHGTLDCELMTPCARCLEAFRLPIHAELSVMYVPRSKLAKNTRDAGERDLAAVAEEADTLPFDGEVVALDDLVRDELVLEVPMIPLCSEGCPGISPAPDRTAREGDSAVDPRLAPLLELSKSHQAKKS
jgi:uncharacterized protein